MPINVLVVGEDGTTTFAARLLRALPPGSTARFALPALTPQERFDLVIVDATAVEKFVDTINELRRMYPEAIFLGVSLSLTWGRVRDAFRAGVRDYVSKSIEEQELRRLIQELLGNETSPAHEMSSG
jgi:DNA-binding NarL/FixJ family response regulator